jgi:4-amino-4-deoxy-L-arabinose transferase-like glycosyltransferase
MLCLAVVFFVTAASTTFMVGDPVPAGWDEAEYVNRALLDREALGRGPKPFAGQLLKSDTIRPPAYRILHVPLTLAVGVTTRSLRLVSFAGLLLTVWLVYLAVSQLAGTSAGIFSAVFVLPLPVVLGPATSFGTEYALYVAVAGLLWSLVRMLRHDAWKHEYLVLGGFLGLGLLAKLTFLPIALPLISVLTLARVIGLLERPRVVDLAKAIAVGLLIAGPWYAWNLKAALWYGNYASNFVRHSLPSSSFPGRTLAYVALIVESGFGYCLAALAVLTCGLALRRCASGRSDWAGHGRGIMLLACIASAAAIVCMQLLSRNQNPRFTAPALILVGAAVGILAGGTSLVTSRRFFALSGVLVLCQVGLMLTHWPYDGGFSSMGGVRASTLFEREPGWDWGRLKALCLDRLGERSTLRIGVLGSGGFFYPPQITHAWMPSQATRYQRMRFSPGRHTDVGVTWLWHYEEGPLDWQKLVQSLDRYDVLLTMPHFIGNPANKEDLDNAHNIEFVERLAADSRFAPPVVIQLVESGPDVYVYFRHAGE